MPEEAAELKLYKVKLVRTQVATAHFAAPNPVALRKALKSEGVLERLKLGYTDPRLSGWEFQGVRVTDMEESPSKYHDSLHKHLIPGHKWKLPEPVLKKYKVKVKVRPYLGVAFTKPPEAYLELEVEAKDDLHASTLATGQIQTNLLIDKWKPKWEGGEFYSPTEIEASSIKPVEVEEVKDDEDEAGEAEGGDQES